jgi:signal transduction histidine kinase
VTTGKADNHDTEIKRSVISRLAGSTALLAAVLIVLAIYFFQLLHSVFFNRAYTAPLTNWTTTIAERIIEDPAMAQAVARNHQVGIILDYPEYTIAYDRHGLEIDPSLFTENEGHFRRIEVVFHERYNIVFYLDRAVFGQVENRLLFGVVIAILVVISIIYMVQLSWLRPLQWLRNGVEKVAKGDFSTRVPIVRNDEIGQVGKAFNNMIERIVGMMDDRDRLLADVSHELRSPIARMRVALEMMPENNYSTDIRRDILQMESLTTALLEREKLIAGGKVQNLVDVDLTELLTTTIDPLESLGPGINWLPPTDQLSVKGNVDTLSMLFQNLLDNSIKFSKPDSKPIQVSAFSRDKHVVVCVDDDGIGIAVDKSDIVFKPFVKLDAARGHGSGYGLGLNLCERIVKAHNGTISIEPKSEGGLRIMVTLPHA